MNEKEPTKLQETVEKKLNVYQKLQKVRAQIGDMGLKKTGQNTYSNFTYYELSDFLPTINRLNQETGLMTFFEIKKDENGYETAFLDIINSENPEEIVTFRSETADVEIGKKRDGTGGADKIQNIGGKQTYLRRYLLIMAYEISENDLVDAQKSKNDDEVELDQTVIDQINSAKTLEELISFSKSAKDLYPEKRKGIVNIYSAKKVALEKEMQLEKDKNENV